MHTIVQRGLVATAAAALIGCALTLPPEEDPLYLKVNGLNERLARVESILDNNSLMSLVSEIEQLRRTNQELRNDVEVLQHDLQQSRERQRALYQDIDQRLQAVESRSTGPGHQDTARADLPGQPAAVGDDRSRYQAAFDLLKQGRYEQAGVALQKFLATFPDSELADNAQYWLAETYYVSQHFEKALPEFQKVLDRYPDAHKIPDALLKIGYCNYELGHWDAALKVLHTVSTDYPESTAARLADQRLERMNREKPHK